MSTLAVYPGSFDPLTNGHVDIITRGSRLFDRIIVAILVNAEKAPLFTMAERVEVAREVFASHPNVEVDTFDGLLVDYVERRNAQVIVRGLRAGHPFRVALALVAREMPDPIGSEFGIVADEIMFGLEQSVVVDNLAPRVGHRDLSFFSTAVNIQHQTGGNLAEILSRLSRMLRSRLKLRLKIRALSSEGRLSAIVLSLTPFILFVIITLLSPDYFFAIKDHPITVPAMIVGALMLVVGNVVMYRMVNFKF